MKGDVPLREVVVYFKDFSPLIQVLAGIFLLLLYDKFITRNPFYRHLSIVLHAISEILVLSGFNSNYGTQLIKTLKEFWKCMYYGILQRIYFSNLLYCLFLLAYAGRQEIEGRYAVSFLGLYLSWCYLIGFTLWCVFFKNKKRGFLAYFVTTLAYLLFFLLSYIPVSDIFSSRITAIISILLISTGLFATIICGIVCYQTYQRCYKKSRTLQNFYDYIVNRITSKKDPDYETVKSKLKYNQWVYSNPKNLNGFSDYIEDELILIAHKTIKLKNRICPYDITDKNIEDIHECPLKIN